MTTLTTVPIEKIVAGDNPRGEIDQTTEAFAELCGSIEDRGVLQSILVGPERDGKHTVIAGHRRFAAARKVKLPEIPAIVVDAGGAELTLALIENIQREDLSPIAEARAIRQLREQHGLTQEKAAEALNKSVRWARDRERLADLPEKTQEAFDAGAIPLEAAPEIAKIAEKAPKVAEALAELVQRDDALNEYGEAFNFARKGEIDYALGEFAEEAFEDIDLGCMVSCFDTLTLASLKRAGVDTGGKLPELAAKFKHLAELYGYDPHGVRLRQEDIDAAEAFGCLVEVEGEYRATRYIVDAEWLADRAAQLLDDEIARVEKHQGAAEPKPAEKGDEISEEALKEARRREREEEMERRAAARANNLELGQRVEKALRSPKLSLDEAKLLALMAVGGQSAELGARGLVYCYHDYQDDEHRANGSTKITYAGGRAAGEDLIRAIKAAKKPEEAFGLALRALVLASFADEDVVAPSNRSRFDLRHGNHEDVPGLIEAVATKRELLPDAVRAEAEERRQREAEEAEGILLRAVLASRAKAGPPRAHLLRFSGVTPAAVDQAVDAKRLKEHDGEEPSYTITAAGKKRLEKLKKGSKAG